MYRFNVFIIDGKCHFFPLATELKIFQEEIKKRKIVDDNERPPTKDERFKFEHELDVVVSTPLINFDFLEDSDKGIKIFKRHTNPSIITNYNSMHSFIINYFSFI